MATDLFSSIDTIFNQYLEQHPDLHEKWLLEQTLYTGQERRNILRVLPIQPDTRVLDLGTGFGALALDLSVMKPVQIDAVDVDSATVQVAQELSEQLRALPDEKPQSTIHYANANIYQLPFADATFDFIMARYLFQHLTDPRKAMAEAFRVLKPGAMICLIDIDDQLTISYPEDLPEFQTLKQAFSQLQTARAGDRLVGRKLASFIHQAGLNVVASIISPMSQFTNSEKGDITLELTVKKFEASRAEILHAGLLSEQEFDRCLHTVATNPVGWQFNTNGQMIVIGQRPQ